MKGIWILIVIFLIFAMSGCLIGKEKNRCPLEIIDIKPHFESGFFGGGVYMDKCWIEVRNVGNQPVTPQFIYLESKIDSEQKQLSAGFSISPGNTMCYPLSTWLRVSLSNREIKIKIIDERGDVVGYGIWKS